MHMHEIVKIDAAAFSGLHWCPVSEVRGAIDANFGNIRGTRIKTILVPLIDLKFLYYFAAGTAGTSNRLHWPCDSYGLGHETQAIDRGDRRLDTPDAGAEPGAGRRRAGSEEGRLPAARLV